MSIQFFGEIRAVAFNFAPQGWLPCDGRELEIAQYEALYKALGTTYGGDGVTTFALPDYRGRAPVGMGIGPGLHGIEQGEQGGAQELTLTSAHLPTHPHDASATIAGSFASSSSEKPADNIFAVVTLDDGITQLFSYAPPTTANATLAPDAVTVTVQPAGDSQPVPLMNPYLGTNFVMSTYADADPDNGDVLLGEIRVLSSPLSEPSTPWAPCEGQLLSIAQNQQLFSLLRNTFGGDGVTTFALPDYRGRAAVGVGGPDGGITQGQQGGSQELTLEREQMPQHTHATTASIAVAMKPGVSESPAGNIPAIVVNDDGITQLPAYAPAKSANAPLAPSAAQVTVQPTGDNQAVPLMNPYLGTRFVIALQGIYPSRA
jgi:microcystin-dependent protein